MVIVRITADAYIDKQWLPQMGALQALMCTFLTFKFPGTELARARLYPILQGVAELWSCQIIPKLSARSQF